MKGRWFSIIGVVGIFATFIMLLTSDAIIQGPLFVIGMLLSFILIALGEILHYILNESN